jgi:MFS superfamily sulfate permease-like transporter
MAQIPHSLMNLNHEIAIIGFSGLVILILWAAIKNQTLRMVPAPLVVVLVGIGLAKYFDLDHEHMYLFLPDAHFLPHHEETVGPKFLVAISENFMSSFYLPDFSKVATVQFWEAVISISLVGSLESLLSATAVDKLDPYKRHSNLDRDLAAVGFGNFVAGCIGGLPMIAEIVRSSANVNNGAKTSWANFFHGLFLLIFVGLFPRLIHSIPLAALAALLVFTGYRLASPQSFKHVLSIGTEQFALFVITIIGVLGTDLLIGVCIGIFAKLTIHIIRGVPLNNLFKIHFDLRKTAKDTYTLELQGSAIFSNFLPLKKALSHLETGKTVVIDLSEGFLVDHTVMEFLHDFIHDYEASGGSCLQHGAPIIPFSGHALAARIMSGKH